MRTRAKRGRFLAPPWYFTNPYPTSLRVTSQGKSDSSKKNVTRRSGSTPRTRCSPAKPPLGKDKKNSPYNRDNP